MDDTRKWKIGTAIAIFTIILTIFGFWLDAYRDAKKECTDLTFQYSQAVHKYKELQDIDNELEDKFSSSQNDEKIIRESIDKASKYFGAQEAENKVAKLIKIFIDAQESIEKEYGPSFFDHPTHNGRNSGEIWIDFLEEEGFPENPTATQAMVRELLYIGLDDDAGDMIALPQPDKSRINYITDKLYELKNSVERQRDQYFSFRFQGVDDKSKVIKPLESKLVRLEERLDVIQERRNDVRSEMRQINAKISLTCKRLYEKECEFQMVSEFNCGGS